MKITIEQLQAYMNRVHDTVKDNYSDSKETLSAFDVVFADMHHEIIEMEQSASLRRYNFQVIKDGEAICTAYVIAYDLEDATEKFAAGEFYCDITVPEGVSYELIDIEEASQHEIDEETRFDER